jgi:membrane protein implicated in regulation of membrane protease activity
MAQNIEAAAPVWKTSIIAATILGGILFIGGIILAILGATAESTFTLFGTEFSSTSVGVALAFIGAVLDIIIIQRVLTSVDAASKGKGMLRPGDPETKKPGPAK